MNHGPTAPDLRYATQPHPLRQATRLTPLLAATRRPLRVVLAALAPLAAAACGDGGSRAPRAANAAAEPAPIHIDSVFPVEEEIRRFRAELPEVTALQGGAASRDALVAGFLDALARRDAAAIGALTLTPAEFAWLYYPHTHFTQRPYELSPALLWFQFENYGSKGLNRALARYGGDRLGGYFCAEPAQAEGPNRIHSGCVVHRVSGTGTASLSLFGPILERDGRFKFVSLANGL